MRFYLCIVLSMLLIACDFFDSRDREFPQTIKGLKMALKQSIFQENVKVSINVINDCEIEYESQWNSETSIKKGYEYISTVVSINFRENFESTAFVSSHIRTSNGVDYQSWGNLVEINFREDVSVIKKSIKNIGDDELVSSYNIDYISIGVAEPNNYDKISELLKIILTVANRCSSK